MSNFFNPNKKREVKGQAKLSQWAKVFDEEQKDSKPLDETKIELNNRKSQLGALVIGFLIGGLKPQSFKL